MEIQTIDRSLLKNVLIEILEEREDLLVKALELFLKKKNTATDEEKEAEMLESFINEHFDKYDEVFKALA